MANSQNDEVLLEELLEEFIEQHRLGYNPSIESYAAKYPDMAEEILELFPTILAMEELKHNTNKLRLSCGIKKLKYIGDFRILRELGRGGMGIVYEAEQESLKRRVALKVLPKQLSLKPKRLKRFIREAQIASRLHHTNIVSIFGVGEDKENAIHYYIMQYIKGISLDSFITYVRNNDKYACDINTIIKKVYAKDQTTRRIIGNKIYKKEELDRGYTPIDLPKEYYKQVARFVIQTANALEYAHEHKTLHRDIKPANLLLDLQENVWITDFGLAKATHTENVTATGEITGTLRYMAPEQFEFKSDRKSDIYSLGATLYELITLRPAFEEEDRTKLLYDIAHGNIITPRKLNPKIPRDIEKIILKAMAISPEYRYKSAKVLANDLEAFLYEKPLVTSRRTLMDTTWRWYKKNATLSVLIAIVVLLLLYTTAYFANLYFEIQEKFEKIFPFREKSKIYRSVAENIFIQSVKILKYKKKIEYQEGKSIQVPDIPIVTQKTNQFITTLEQSYEQLKPFHNKNFTYSYLDIQEKKALIYQYMGKDAQAIHIYKSIIKAYNKRRKQSKTLTSAIKVIDLQNILSEIYRKRLDYKKARYYNKNSLSLLKRLLHPKNHIHTINYKIAVTYFGMSKNTPKMEKIDGIYEVYLEKAMFLFQRSLNLKKNTPEHLFYLALCYREKYLREQEKKHLYKAITMLEKLVQKYPSIARYKYELCRTYMKDDKKENWRKAAIINTNLLKENPSLILFLDLKKEILRRNSKK